MRLKAVLSVLITFCALNHSNLVSAQIVTTRTDSVLVAKPQPDPDENRIVKTEKDKGLSKPGRAALYSAIIPGAGQVYNGHYWKVPVIYVIGGTLGYFIYDNNKQYQQYRLAYLYAKDSNTETVPIINNKPTNLSANALRSSRDFYRRNRDLSIIFSVLAYGLNVMEANVGAHLNEFDISDDLSMNWEPSVQYASFGMEPAPGLSLHFRLKH